MSILKEKKIHVFDKDVIRVGMPIQVVWKGQPFAIDNGIVAKIDGTILSYVCANKDGSGTRMFKVESSQVSSGIATIRIGRFEKE